MSITELNYKAYIHTDPKQLGGYAKTGVVGGNGGVSQGQGSELAAWYEDARDYYNQVMSGEVEAPPQGKWLEFLDQMQWAHDQMWVGNFGGSGDWDVPEAQEGKRPALPLPQGAEAGLDNSVVWTRAKANIDFNGDERVQHIWSNEITLNVSSLSATVYAEKTQTSLNPPSPVVKIIVQDQATGAVSVYFVHDYEDAKLTINTPTGKINQDGTGGFVMVGTLVDDENQKPTEDPEKPQKEILPVALNPDHAEDSIPRLKDEKTGSAIYDLDSDVSIHTHYDDTIHTHDISASGTVTLHGFTQKDAFSVDYDYATDQFIITVTGSDKAGNQKTESYKVDGHVTRIILDPPAKISIGLRVTKEQAKKIQKGLDPEAAKEPEVIKWPRDRLSLNVSPKSPHFNESIQLANMIDAAEQGRSVEAWKAVTKYINDSMQGWDTNANCPGGVRITNMLRQFLSALYRASGAESAEDPKFTTVLRMIPSDIRVLMKQALLNSPNQSDVKGSGDVWNTREAVEILLDSLDQ